MNNIIKFQEKELNTYDLNGQIWLVAKELAKGLGYSDDRTVQRIYTRHSDEFTDDMAGVVKLTTPKGGVQETRIFSPRGCHLIAMFARTPFAKEFRKWVLDVLEKMNTCASSNAVSSPYSITADKEAMKAIGGMVKRCCATAIKETLLTENPNLANAVGCLIDYIAEERAKKKLDEWKAETSQRVYIALNGDALCQR